MTPLARRQLCSNERRCQIIRTLYRERAMDIRALADEIAHQDHDDTPTEGQRDEVLQTLRHHHLPKLADHGVVELASDLPAADDFAANTIVHPTPLSDALARDLHQAKHTTPRGDA